MNGLKSFFRYEEVHLQCTSKRRIKRAGKKCRQYKAHFVSSKKAWSQLESPFAMNNHELSGPERRFSISDRSDYGSGMACWRATPTRSCYRLDDFSVFRCNRVVLSIKPRRGAACFIKCLSWAHFIEHESRRLSSYNAAFVQGFHTCANHFSYSLFEQSTKIHSWWDLQRMFETYIFQSHFEIWIYELYRSGSILSAFCWLYSWNSKLLEYIFWHIGIRSNCLWELLRSFIG